MGRGRARGDRDIRGREGAQGQAESVGTQTQGGRGGRGGERRGGEGSSRFSVHGSWFTVHD